MSHIYQILNSFEPIALEEMEKVKLMDRVDSKYMFTLQTLPELLEACRAHYYVVSIHNQRYASYETVYYDTNDLSLYNRHHAGKLNRYKIRERRYVESNLSFLEVKFKDNKGRTRKTRVKLKTDAIDDRAVEFIEKETPLKVSDLKPSIKIDYNRITLVNKDLSERITIDINLHVSRNTFARSFKNLVIAEVKQNRSARSEFTHLMRELRIKEGSMSKYCIGISSLLENVKKNNFKEKNRNITKLNNV